MFSEYGYFKRMICHFFKFKIKKMQRSILIVVICLFIGNLFSQSDTCQGRPEDRFRVLFLLDASYSMEKKWGKETLWDVARKTIEDFAYFLQKNYNVEMGLRVYGHNSPVTLNDCEDSRLEVPIEENSASKIVNKLKLIKYKGTTPLTYSLEKAAEDLGCNSKKNIIILITDGYETCNRNPCAMAEKLLDYRISIKPLIVGLNIDPKEIQHLHCIGDFKNAKNKEEFKKELMTSFVNIANRRSFSIFLKNGAKKLSESNIPFTIYHSKSREVIASFYHHLTPNTSLPDTITIGNVDTIDIKIHSTPPVYLLKQPLKKYVHNSIMIDYPKGTLYVHWDTAISKIYEQPIGLILKDSTVMDKFYIPSKIDLLEDNYQLAIHTTPSIDIAPLPMNRTKIQDISIPAPGILTVIYSTPIYGDIYSIGKGGLKKCYSLSSHKTSENIHLLPGKYKLIYRTQRSITIHGTFEKEFQISSFGTVSIAL